MKKTDLKFSPIAARDKFIKECVFNEWMPEYNRFCEILEQSSSTEDFIFAVGHDDTLLRTQGYAEICKEDDEMYAAALDEQEKSATSVFRTASECGGVRIMSGDFGIIAPNGVGDGETTVLVFGKRDKAKFNDCLFEFWTSVEGNFGISPADWVNAEPVVSLSGRYGVYYACDIVVFEEWD